MTCQRVKGHQKPIAGLAFLQSKNILVSSAADTQATVGDIITCKHYHLKYELLT